MFKRFFTAILIVFVFSQIFAGGQKETGRDQAADTAENGQLISTGMIDSVNYLFDFEIETENDTDLPLKISVDLLKDKIWQSGDSISFRIALQTNTKEYFNKAVNGNFIIYVENPELWKNEEFTSYICSLPRNYSNLKFYTFDVVDQDITHVTADSIKYEIFDLKYRKKNYNHSLAFQKLLESLEKNQISERTHILWITDENIVETTSDANFFSFATNVMSSVDTTFSYLGYGETPNWTLLNTNLVELNGNTFFAEDVPEIIQKISDAVLYFAYPAVEDININIVLNDDTYLQNTFYPKSIYGTIKNFSPSKHNGIKKTHYLGGMNYDETNRFIHYISIPEYMELTNTMFMPTLEDGKYKIAEVYVDYFVPMFNKRYYYQEDLYITYVDSTEMSEEMNKYVYADTIIQNTPFVILEIAELSKTSSKYLIAIQLVNKQRTLLQEVLKIRPDKAIEQDIELLSKYYQILYEQAKVMNLIN